MESKALVTGAGGFIGGHLVDYLKNKGYYVVGTDIKEPEFRTPNYDLFVKVDLRNQLEAKFLVHDFDEVYALAADMGGMGFISTNHAQILYNNMMINMNLLDAAKEAKVDRYFYSSSACIYPEYKQTETNVVPLKEEDAYPAQPQDAYGWEKLLTERLCTHYREDYGIKTRIARFHNIFGPYGSWTGGREKAPAAMCRKVAEAKLFGRDYIEIWGDGEQTRSFCYVDDALDGIYALTHSDYVYPLNIGQDRMVTINELADIVMKIADVDLEKKHVDGPQGVRGRNSDNSKVKEVLDWEFKISLEEGMSRTYEWIEKQVIDNDS